MVVLSKRAQNLHQGAIRAMFDKAATMDRVISMGIGEPDMATPMPICEAAAMALRNGQTHYTPNAGTLECRRAVSEWGSIKELHYDPQTEIIITPGGMGALSLLLSVIVEDGVEILIQDPQWLNYASQVQFFGGIPVSVSTCAERGFVIQAEDIEHKITEKTKALMLNSPNNPTGAVIPEEELGKIAEVAIRHDLLVISDEVYDTLYYKDKPVSISTLPGMKERTVVINSLSKAFAMTGWRIGFAAGPAEIISKMVPAQENISACANAPAQAAAVYALHHPELSETLCTIFRQRRKIITDGLNAIPGIFYDEPAGAFYVFPNIQSFGMTSSEFCNRLLEEEHVVCIPGSAFGQAGEGYMRMAYTCSEDELVEGLQRIKRFCETIRGNQI